VTVLDPRDVAPQQAGPFFDIPLRESFRIAEFANACANTYTPLLGPRTVPSSKRATT
jgi:hypothetical protein